jgi:hypothetical protein
MTVNEAIEHLTALREKGYGDVTVRCYTEGGNDPYKPITIELHPPEDSQYGYPQTYGTWVEVY